MIDGRNKMTVKEIIEVLKSGCPEQGKLSDAIKAAIHFLESNTGCEGCTYDLPEICPIPCLNCKRIALDHYEKKKRISTNNIN